MSFIRPWSLTFKVAFPLCLSLLLLCVVAGWQRNVIHLSRASSGQVVYIVDGKTNVKLVDSHLRLFTREQIDAVLFDEAEDPRATRTWSGGAMREKLFRTRKSESEIPLPTYQETDSTSFFEALPKPLQEADIDTDGMIHTEIKSGKDYVVVISTPCEPDGLPRLYLPTHREGFRGTIFLLPCHNREEEQK